MKFKKYANVQDFYHDTFDILARHETQNMILLGNLIIGYEGKDKMGWRDPKNWLMATVSDENGVLLTALMTPPHNITLFPTDNITNLDAVNCLVENLLHEEIPGVMTEKSFAELFANQYTKAKNMTYETVMSQGVFELTKVNPDIKKFGTIRLLEERDMTFFPFWVEAFAAAEQYGSTQMQIPQAFDYYQYRLDSKKIYVLEVDGIPVTMAGFTREMLSAIGVAFVYTPPYFCKKGYATSCVAQLSQIALDKGFKKCVLNTDLKNPTSNSIYQKIGYQKICDSMMLRFINDEAK